MSYTIGASPAQTMDEKGAAIKALNDAFDRFESIVTQGAKDIQSQQPDLAGYLRKTIPSLRAGMANVIAGKLDPQRWIDAINGLIEQVRLEAPWYSITELRAASETIGGAAKTAILAIARTARETIKEGTGKDPGELIDTAASVAKYGMVAAVVVGAAYLYTLLPKPSRKPAS